MRRWPQFLNMWSTAIADPTAAGYLTAYPCGTEPPAASNVNYVDGETIANLATVKVTASRFYLFNPVATSAPGIRLREHLPHLARQAHHLAIVRSLGDRGRGTGDHHAGYYYNLTGHAPDRAFHQ